MAISELPGEIKMSRPAYDDVRPVDPQFSHLLPATRLLQFLQALSLGTYQPSATFSALGGAALLL